MAFLDNLHARWAASFDHWANILISILGFVALDEVVGAKEAVAKEASAEEAVFAADASAEEASVAVDAGAAEGGAEDAVANITYATRSTMSNVKAVTDLRCRNGGDNGSECGSSDKDGIKWDHFCLW